MAAPSTAPSGIFDKKTCCVVTGASRGLGKAIAINLASKLSPPSLLVLLSRDTETLERVKMDIRQKSELVETTSIDIVTHSSIDIVTHSFDQANLDQRFLGNLFAEILAAANRTSGDFEQAIIVHNAGTLGDPSKYVRDLTDVDTVKHNFDMNVSGMILLNSAFLQTFTEINAPSRIVVQITSLSGVQPHKSWSLYCTGK
jgi:sepiapterin reductase